MAACFSGFHTVVLADAWQSMARFWSSQRELFSYRDCILSRNLKSDLKSLCNPTKNTTDSRFM